MLACVYHLYTSALYAAPVLLMGGWLWRSNHRHKRRTARPTAPRPDVTA
jgi:hypothetical protein